MGVQTAYTLTPPEASLLAFITKRIEETGGAPSYREMAENLGLGSISRIHFLVKALEERGHIVRLANRARAISLPRDDDDRCVTLPLGLSERIRASATYRATTPADLIEKAYRFYTARVG